MMKADPDRRRRLLEGVSMFKPRQYRAKAVEFGDLAKTSTDSKQKCNFQKLEHRFAALADNEQWLADNYQSSVSSAELERSDGITLPDEEEHILRCLGAALILKWNTLPTKLQRELFDNAGSMGALLETAALRGQIARFLHKHKNDENTAAVAAIRPDTVYGDADIHAASIARWDDEGGACPMPEQPMRKRQNY
jgi:hypothetical protein